MKDPNCAYCMEGDLVAKFGIKICELDNALVYLFKEQSHKGRCIQKAFNPDKINMGAYGDTAGHTHFHLVPKYKDEFEWTQVFAMNPERVFLSDGEYEEVIAKIKENL